MTQRRGLGRGLAALIPNEEREDGSDGQSPLREIALDAIRPNARQPREIFDEGELDDLAASIREVGLLQPVVVRPAGPEGAYELVAGERRWRASRRAGLERIPALVRDTSDNELLREAVIENIHRVQLNPLEEAAAFQQLLEDFDVTHDELSKRLGKSRPTITNSLRLLSLPAGVQRKVAARVLSAGHAKALLSLERREDQERLADRIIAEGLSVRSTEEIVRIWSDEDDGDAGGSRRATPARRRITAPGLQDLEERLSDALHTRVTVAMGARKGRLTMEFGSVGDLERLVGVIAQGLQTPITVQEESLRPHAVDDAPSEAAPDAGADADAAGTEVRVPSEA